MNRRCSHTKCLEDDCNVCCYCNTQLSVGLQVPAPTASKLHPLVEPYAKGKRHNTAARVVSAFLQDLTDRSGLDGAWDGIDRETQKEIVETWCSIVAAELAVDQ